MGRKYIILGNSLQNNIGFSAADSGPGDDIKAKVTVNDTTTDYLDSKVAVTGGNISKVVINPGANEQLQLASLDQKIKASVADTTPDDLNNKLTVSGGLVKTISSPGGDESINIDAGSVGADEKVKSSAADTTTNYLNNKITVSGRVSKTLNNPGANENIELETGDHFTLYYCNPSALLVAGEFLWPPDLWWDQWKYTMGYHSNTGFKIKKITIGVTRFSTAAQRNFTIRFREYIADGSKLTPFTTGDGTIIGDVITTLSNTGSVWHYVEGSTFDVDWAISSNNMLFCYIQASDVDFLTGVNLYLHCYKTPI